MVNPLRLFSHNLHSSGLHLVFGLLRPFPIGSGREYLCIGFFKSANFLNPFAPAL